MALPKSARPPGSRPAHAALGRAVHTIAVAAIAVAAGSLAPSQALAQGASAQPLTIRPTAPPLTDAPRDPGHGPLPSSRAPNDPSHGPAADLLLLALDHYQHHIGPNSVSRCPFVLSCSHFAVRALQRFGILGLPMLLDRYLIRENTQAYDHYQHHIGDDGRLRLDDGGIWP